MATADAQTMEEYYSQIRAKHLDALWLFEGAEASLETVTAPYRPCRWRWAEVGPLLERAGELIEPGPESQRRVLLLSNPGLAPTRGATHNLSMAVQMVLPGEQAPSHRHTMTAIRFMVRGRAVTIVNGEPCVMEPGDLVLTPNWAWHGHTNETDGPAVWVDNLDSPLVRALRMGIFEDFPEGMEPASKQRNQSQRKLGRGHLRPVQGLSPDPISPLLSYPWAQTEEALHELASIEADPYDDIALEYTNPSTGGHVLPTLSCRIQMLRPGAQTRAHRHSSSVGYYVFRGSGYSVVDGVRIDWQEGDFLALPPWAWHEHANASKSDEAILYSSSDVPVLESLRLYFEQPYESNGGHQQVVASYQERYT